MFTFQVGANTAPDNRIDITTVNVGSVMTTATTDGATATVGTSASGAQAAITAIDTAIAEVSLRRAGFGATQNRFESVISNLQVAAENQASARGRIMDADFARETSNLSRGQILQQAGTAMVAQANQLPQGVLALLR